MSDDTVERVARAMWEVAPPVGVIGPAKSWDEALPPFRDQFRRVAQAAIDAMKAPEAFDPIAALRRVEALADHWDTVGDGRFAYNRIAKGTAARALRAALASPADTDPATGQGAS